MSGLVGIWNMDGEPVSPELLRAMSSRIKHRGPDGETLAVNGSVGFACQLLRVTPESLHERQPFSNEAGCTILWDGRLDNREEIIAGLSASSLDTRKLSDPALTLLAYESYGMDFANRLEGDFAFSIFDPVHRHLLLVRDVMGGRSLDYCRFGNHFLFSSEIKALLAHPAVRTAPDEQRLAEWIYHLFDYSDESSTFFKDIHTVPAGCMVIIQPEKSTIRRYWDFDPTKRLRLRKYEDYVQAYQELFTRAVRCRLRSAFPVGIAVSGGLDSSSIYCVAHEATNAAPQELPRIFGVTLVTDHPSTDESMYQRAVEEKCGIQLLRIPYEMRNPAGEIELDTWHGEGPASKGPGWRDYYRVSMQQGARVLVSGYFGDHLLMNPQYLLDLAFQGHLRTLYRHVRSFYGWWDHYPARLSTRDLWVNLKGYLVPDSLRPLYHKVRMSISRQPTHYPPWYSDRFTAKARELESTKTLLRFDQGGIHTAVLLQQVRSRMQALRLSLERKIDYRFPCEQVYPFRDRRLVEFIMSIPGEVIYHSGSRGIHRDALKGVLPELVRLRNNKTPYGHPHKIGKLHDLDSFGKRLGAGIASKMGFLADKPTLEVALDGLRNRIDIGDNATYYWMALDVLALEAWLSSFFGDESH